MDEIAALRARADPERAAQVAQRHKSGRETLGLSPAQIAELTAEWRPRPLDERMQLASKLWDADLHESRLIAARLLAQARIAGDDTVWQMLTAWLPDLDGAVIADAVATALQKRVAARPGRLDEVETWLDSPNPWILRCALSSALPFAKKPHPKPEDIAARQRAHAWAGRLSSVRHGAVQQAVVVWLRTLTPRDPAAVRAFIAAQGDDMTPHALTEARRVLSDQDR